MAGSFTDPTLFEIRELGDACAELSDIINSVHGFSSRSQNIMGGANSPRLINIQTSQKPSTAGAAVANAPAGGPIPTSQSSKGKQLKILIFVALEEELNVLVKQLKLTRPSGKPATGTIGDVTIDVVCPRSMGRVAAAVTVAEYLSTEDPKPDLVLCVGLAGGFIEEGIVQGIIICVDTVVDLATRKVTDTDDGKAQSRFRRQDFHCERRLYDVAKSSDFDKRGWEDYCREEFHWPDGKVPSLREGNIASADEVVASDDHRKKMLASGDRLLGVEMEAGGACAAAKRFNVPFEVIRVVSDQADPVKTDDEWRRIGMQTLAELLKRLPLEKVIPVGKA
jgi:nucleoside phosphorylase